MAGEDEGPGEFRMAMECVFLPDGTIGVVQVMPLSLLAIWRLAPAEVVFRTIDRSAIGTQESELPGSFVRLRLGWGL